VLFCVLWTFTTNQPEPEFITNEIREVVGYARANDKSQRLSIPNSASLPTERGTGQRHIGTSATAVITDDTRIALSANCMLTELDQMGATTMRTDPSSANFLIPNLKHLFCDLLLFKTTYSSRELSRSDAVKSEDWISQVCDLSDVVLGLPNPLNLHTFWSKSSRLYQVTSDESG